jgi:tripartite-type tricarboxylate transporter receptor subunit TctC
MTTAGTPPAAIARLSEALGTALASPLVIQRMASAGVDPEASSSEELGLFIARESEKWGRVVREARITVE